MEPSNHCQLLAQYYQGRIKGGQLPRALRSKGAPRDDIHLF